MNATYNRGLHRFSVFTAIWTVFLFIAGALVTSNDAALSVPDWPKSFGKWFPSLRQLAGGAFFEHSHRVIAFILGLLVLALAILVWIADKRTWLRWFGVAAVGGVVVQAVLGGEVVRQLLQYWLPVLHACFAQIIFAAVVSIAVFTSRWWLSEPERIEDSGAPSIHTIAFLNALIIYCQVFFGATFRHKDLPLWPHLVGSGAVLTVVTWTAVVLRKRFGNSPELTRARIYLHSIFGIQFLLGGAAWWSRSATADAPQPMPIMVWMTVAHTVVGALLFGLSVVIVLLSYRLVPRRREVAASAAREVTAQ